MLHKYLKYSTFSSCFWFIIIFTERERECVCVCVCERERERERDKRRRRSDVIKESKRNMKIKKNSWGCFLPTVTCLGNVPLSGQSKIWGYAFQSIIRDKRLWKPRKPNIINRDVIRNYDNNFKAPDCKKRDHLPVSFRLASFLHKTANSSFDFWFSSAILHVQ